MLAYQLVSEWPTGRRPPSPPGPDELDVAAPDGRTYRLRRFGNEAKAAFDFMVYHFEARPLVLCRPPEGWRIEETRCELFPDDWDAPYAVERHPHAIATTVPCREHWTAPGYGQEPEGITRSR